MVGIGELERIDVVEVPYEGASLPAILVSERIYRIPSASFEMYKAGTLRATTLAPLGGTKRRPRLGEGETLPKSRNASGTVARAR